MLLNPPATSTLPVGRRVAVKLSRRVLIDPTGTHASGPPPKPPTATCAVLGALSASMVVAVRNPVMVGTKRTDTVQVPPGATGALAQLVKAWKSPGWAPVSATPLAARSAEPSLVTR